MRGRLNASRPGVALCLIAAVLLVVAPPAGATSGWSPVPSPKLPGYGQVYLYGVSCPSTTSCFAVGSQNPSSGPVYSKALMEHWNGHTWSIMTSPKPAGSPGDAYLNGVSCPTTTSCFAVGYVQSGHAPNAFSTLVEHWNGHSWAIMTSPNRVGSGTPNNYLNGVSCRSTTSCFAVGFSIFHGWKTLVEHWNGRAWSIMTSPNPTGFQYHVLGGVSCPSVTSCYAVGDSQGSSTQALVEHWNGHNGHHDRPHPHGYEHLEPVPRVVPEHRELRRRRQLRPLPGREDARGTVERPHVVDHAQPQPRPRNEQRARRRVVSDSSAMLRRRRVLPSKCRSAGWALARSSRRLRSNGTATRGR